MLLCVAMPETGGETFRVMIVAGEPSGDAHAASLVRALRGHAPGVSFGFFGGTQGGMRAEGVETVVATDELSITGLLEIGSALPRFWRAYKKLREDALARWPDCVVLVD